MLIRKTSILMLLFAFHVGADVFKTNEIPVVPAEDLIPPPEDQESIIVRFSGNEPIPPKSFFQRIYNWFGFNGDPSKNGRKPPPQKQKLGAQKQNGYVYENPAKPFSPPPTKLQQQQQQLPQTTSYQPPGYQYEDPNKNLQNGFQYDPLKLQQQPQTGYTYDPPAKLQLQPQQNGYSYPPPPTKLQLQPQLQPQIGYTYDPSAKLQQQPQSGYTYNPPPVKLQDPKPTGYSYPPPPVKLQDPSKQPPFSGYNYDPPLMKLQRPLSLNDLASSAASPTAVYGLPPIPGFNQAQTSDTFPCNKVPWLPIFPNPQEMELLRAKLQAKNPNYLQPLIGYQNIQPIARPQPEKFQQHQQQQNQQQQQQLNAHTYLPPRQRPLRQPSINQIASINSLPLHSTAQPFKAPSSTISSEYLPSQKIVLPVETTQHNLVPLQVQSLSITPIPPLYDPKPFTLNDAKANGFYINGHLVTPTGLSTTSVQSLQYVSQNHPVTQSQNIVQPSNSYGAPLTVTQATPAVTYGSPPTTYGPPTNTYGTPPIKLTAEVTESSLFSRFKASQPFTARPSSLSSTLSPLDQSRLSSSNVAQNSNLNDKPIFISDSAADASESTRLPQDANTIADDYQPILQVLHELNVTTTPQGFQYTATSTEPSISISSASQYKKKEKKENKVNSNRETPIDLLDTPIQHFRKTSIGPSNTPANLHDSANGDRVPDFKFMRNTWKPLAPSSFAHSQSPSVVTAASPIDASSVITPSAASAAFQSHTPHDANSLNGNNNARPKTKKVQVIIPYTSNSRPSPFKNTAELQSFESSAGWSNSENHEDHNSQESQLISSATPSPSGNGAPNHHNHHHHHNSPYLTKILAKNIRELLKREHLKNISSIDLEKLQKNIDGWTEQEFSMQLNRASTISLLAPSKHIPFEYLTTTQSLQDIFTTESIQPTTEYPTTSYIDDNTESDIDDSQGEGKQMDEENEDENEIKGLEIGGGGGGENLEPEEQEAIHQAEEIEDDDFKRLDYLKALENNQVSGSEHRIFYATNPPPAQQKPTTTTPIPPCSNTSPTVDNESYARTTVLPSADELWNKLKSLLTASDKGAEKVYIVTPQPYPAYFESEKIVASDDENEVKFKSPRFLVRPTPGAATGRSSNSFARLTFRPRANRLQTTTVKTTWNEASSTEPVNTEIFRSSTHSHSVVNGHAHAQAFSYVKPNSFSDDAHNVQVNDDDEAKKSEEQEDDDLIEADTHRSSLYEYKQ